MGYQARRRHIVVGGAGGVTGEGNGSSATTLGSSTAPESSDTTNGAAAATITASPKTSSSARPWEIDPAKLLRVLLSRTCDAGTPRMSASVSTNVTSALAAHTQPRRRPHAGSGCPLP